MRRAGWRWRNAPLALATVGFASIVTGCGPTGGGAAPEGPPPTDVVVPAVHRGPQGDSGQFVVKCGFSHAAMADPIVHPGHAGASHRHDFFGNVATDAGSTAASLLGGDTTCNLRLDTAAYWAPSLIDHGTPVTPLGAIIYYRPAPGVDPTTLVPYPTGLMMVSGDPTASTPQPVEIAGWACGTSPDLRSEPPVCDPASPLQVRVTFPDCWDGGHLDSSDPRSGLLPSPAADSRSGLLPSPAADHRAHVARSREGRCPPSHPVVLPQLTLTVRYPIAGTGHALELASGSTLTAHADFLNAWDEQELTEQVELCLHRSVVCSVASNRGQDAPIG